MTSESSETAEGVVIPVEVMRCPVCNGTGTFSRVEGNTTHSHICYACNGEKWVDVPPKQ